MTDWFLVEEIDNETFAISEPKHWEEPHSYLVCGRRAAVLIDTGLGVGDIRGVVERLTSLPVLVVTTHVHWDHIGGHRLFENIAVHEAERAWLAERFPLPLSVVRQHLTCRPCEFPPGFDPAQYRIFRGEPNRILHDGDRLELGGRTLSVLHTPGHSPGHCCFYEEERGYLYAGDLICRGCLDAFYPTTDPVLFRQSVQRVRRLAVSRILPGHHSLELSPDLVGRIDAAFSGLAWAGKLRHGTGLADFGEFQIRL